MNGVPVSRVAPSATQAGARDWAWTSAGRSARMRRRSTSTLRSMASGFLVSAWNGTQMPPRACNSLTSRPPVVATSARAPTSARALAMSIVTRSAPPA